MLRRLTSRVGMTRRTLVPRSVAGWLVAPNEEEEETTGVCVGACVTRRPLDIIFPGYAFLRYEISAYLVDSNVITFLSWD